MLVTIGARKHEDPVALLRSLKCSGKAGACWGVLGMGNGLRSLKDSYIISCSPGR